MRCGEGVAERCLSTSARHEDLMSDSASTEDRSFDDLLELHEADLNEAMPFQSGSFDVVMSLDAILHLRDRLAVFREVARVLRSRGKFYFTDAGVITGPISNEEIRLRAAHGYTQF